MPGTLKLNSGGAGNLILTPSGSVGSDVTVTLPASTATLLTNKTAGTVLQVVSNSTTTGVSVSSGTWTDSGASVSITPTSASNKILVITNINIMANSTTYGNNFGSGIRILRGATVIATNGAIGGYWYTSAVSTGATSQLNTPHSINYLDSPATTSSVTYKIQGIGTYANIDMQYGSATTTITVMEIAA